MKVKELFDLTGKVALITGGSVGLGKQMALGLAETGADIAICARKQERCVETAEEISGLGVRVLPLACDVANEEDVIAMVSQVISEFGKIDILINNAGATWGGPPQDLKLGDWEKVFRTNVHGVFLCSKTVGRRMIDRGTGKIINLASVAGLGGADSEVFDAIPYNTSKGAVINFTRDLAVKWAPYNIQVNAIAPGWFPTNMTKRFLDAKRDILLQNIPAKRWGNDDDLKGVTVLLASSASNYITGQIFVVDGGQTAVV